MPQTLQILKYEYVPDIVDKRAPHRSAHLKLVARYEGEDKIVIAGAVGDPPRSGLIVFRDAAEAEAFAAEDPYVEAGLVVKRTIEPWTVVTGS